MYYLKINEKIRALLDLVQVRLGCKDYCKLQLIALDEFEFLRKELETKKFKTFTSEEYKELIKSTEKVYFNNTHVCSSDQPKSINDTTTSDDELNEEELLNELKRDKINKNRTNYFEFKSPDPLEEECSRRKEEEAKNSNKTKSEIQKLRTESSLSYAFSLVASFFLLVLGSYYLGKYFFGLNDSNTFKLVLIITIVVLLSEMFLVVIKMNRESEKNITSGKINENSFAYKFNKRYRDIVESAMRKKNVYDKVKKE